MRKKISLYFEKFIYLSDLLIAKKQFDIMLMILICEVYGKLDRFNFNSRHPIMNVNDFIRS